MTANTGEALFPPDTLRRFADMRAEFERLSRLTPRDPKAERAFIDGKIDLIRSDPHLSEAEKERTIEELKRRLAE